MNFHMSEDESASYGINLYRAKIDDLEEIMDLKSALDNSTADICRVKISANQPNIYSELDRLNTPYQLYNINYANVVMLDRIPEKALEWDSSRYSYVLCSQEHADVLRRLVTDTISSKTWVNYESRIAADFITREKEIEATVQYACSFIDGKEGRKVWLLEHNGQPVGFFMGYPYETGFMGTLYGVAPSFRNAGHSKVMHKILLSRCRNEGLEFFRNEVGILNIPSQKSARSQFLVPVDISLHFELYAFRSHEGESGSRTDAVDTEAMERYVEVEYKSLLGDKRLSLIHVNRCGEGEPVTSHVVPVAVTSGYCLFVIRQFTTGDTRMCRILYLQFSG